LVIGESYFAGAVSFVMHDESDSAGKGSGRLNEIVEHYWSLLLWSRLLFRIGEGMI